MTLRKPKCPLGWDKRICLLAGSIAALSASAFLFAAAPASRQVTDEEAIRPFRAHVPDAALADLRGCLAATRRPDKETVADASRRVQLAKIEELARYWGSKYDWCKSEARQNAFPQFKARIVFAAELRAAFQSLRE